MAAEFVTPEVIASAAARVSLGSNAVAQVEAAVVVNWAAAAVLVPDEQLVVTLQSYKDEALNPDKFAEVPAWAVEKIVQVEDKFNL